MNPMLVPLAVVLFSQSAAKQIEADPVQSVTWKEGTVSVVVNNDMGGQSGYSMASEKLEIRKDLVIDGPPRLTTEDGKFVVHVCP